MSDDADHDTNAPEPDADTTNPDGTDGATVSPLETHADVPESVNDAPASGTNFQS